MLTRLGSVRAIVNRGGGTISSVPKRPSTRTAGSWCAPTFSAAVAAPPVHHQSILRRGSRTGWISRCLRCRISSRCTVALASILASADGLSSWEVPWAGCRFFNGPCPTQRILTTRLSLPPPPGSLPRTSPSPRWGGRPSCGTQPSGVAGSSARERCQPKACQLLGCWRTSHISLKRPSAQSSDGPRSQGNWILVSVSTSPLKVTWNTRGRLSWNVSMRSATCI